MQAKLIFLFALAVCALAETKDNVLYTINEPRFVELIKRINDAGFTETKNTVVSTATSIFCFTSVHVRKILECYSSESNQLKGLEALRQNILDPQFKQNQIIEKFISSDVKKQATDMLANIVACKSEGIAPEKMPTIALPYNSNWPDTEFEQLLSNIDKLSRSAEKIEEAKKVIMGKSLGISSEQAFKLFKAIPFSDDMLTLSESVKDRLIGVTCEQLVSLLAVFSFSDDRLKALKAFKDLILDVENKFSILDAYSFSGDKEKARKILETLRARSHIFGVPEGKVVFLLDYSGSMSTTFTLNTGKKSNRLEFVKSEFAKTVSNFDNKVSFNVYAYAERVIPWKTALTAANDESIPSAIAFSKQFPAYGGTNIYDALRTAWNIPGVEKIYLLTDGSPSAGAKTNPNSILADVIAWKAKNPIKVHTIAFLMGTEAWDNKPASKSFMKSIAEATGGTYRCVESDK